MILEFWDESAGSLHTDQPEEQCMHRKVIWFTYFNVIADICAQAGKASATQIQQNLSTALATRNAQYE